jgi:hypothetical protein
VTRSLLGRAALAAVLSLLAAACASSPAPPRGDPGKELAVGLRATYERNRLVTRKCAQIGATETYAQAESLGANLVLIYDTFKASSFNVSSTTVGNTVTTTTFRSAGAFRSGRAFRCPGVLVDQLVATARAEDLR